MTVKNDFSALLRSIFGETPGREIRSDRKIVLNRHFVLRGGSLPLRQTGIGTRPCSLITEPSPGQTLRKALPVRRAGLSESARSGEARLEGRRTRTRIGPGLAKRNGFTPHYLTLMADSDDCSPSSQSARRTGAPSRHHAREHCPQQVAIARATARCGRLPFALAHGLMRIMAFKKTYVEVTARIDEDGRITPLSVRWRDGRVVSRSTASSTSSASPRSASAAPASAISSPSGAARSACSSRILAGS